MKLVNVAEQIIENARQLMRSPNINISMDKTLSILAAINENTARLTSMVASANDISEDSVVTRMSSLGQPNSEVKKLLLYFKGELRATVRDVLSSTSSGEPRYLRILEECYKRALDDVYFDYIDEAFLTSPYDPDYESEQFYEHEDRLQIDEDYAACFEAERERKYADRMEAREHTKRIWIEFWSQALQKRPGGPTLFIPTDTLGANDLLDTSRYLFRAFDLASPERTDDTVVASAASVYSDLEVDHFNILSLDKEEANSRLHNHLTKGLFGAPDSDNLMSWSNSLLFVIQYAIWRSEQRGWAPEQVQICAIDTTRFPKGQFARDMWLMQQCYDSSLEHNPLDSLISLRKKTGYYNGEHLSQGTVHHKGRSCVFTLQHLIVAGLCELYPEFDDLEGRMGWTNRVLTLRSKWSSTSSTTQRDIHLAIKLADLCFPGMPPLDIALMFLTFKHRKVRDSFRMRISKSGSHSFYTHWMLLK
ncbi:hypothetical protein M436DRAFT_40810 [Aureobasidium namibiae CBS 147.97]|uniref:DUF7587 domain-containing protein n=1 Tax=Aureobasidium namibiae CBS 147.97 TaxID=1043004 RepID=A0A074XM55_9PEZI|nr:uncharacterized protein M436DRAFT_40810 [Aureobasidium namibiae CBS 147.97]KEQ75626.1 hypothetical protein M436DRAFT_40810 [Aureobasidium namibiae CBS 147.97]